MNIAQWWPKLGHETQEWLVEHNGEPLDPAVNAEITALLDGDTDRWLSRGSDSATWELTDEAVDWIDAWANDEDPSA